MDLLVEIKDLRDYLSLHNINNCEQKDESSKDLEDEIVGADNREVNEVESTLLIEETDGSCNAELLNVKEENEKSSKEKSDANARRKSFNKVRLLLNEMLETEKTYVEDLKDVCQLYLPLGRKQENFLTIGSYSLERKKHPKKAVNERRSLQESLDMSNKITGTEMSTFDARVMLANIEELRDYHRKVVLVKMENAGDDASLLRELFTGEVTKMKVKYGRYCINKARSSQVVNNNMEYLSKFQVERGLCHHIDAQLIKPVQRLTRYHMFLRSLAEASASLGETSAALDYRLAQAAVLEAANHTNTLMWIGQLQKSPLDLSRQGNLLKHGPVKIHAKNAVSSSLGVTVWNMCKQTQDCHLFLFQQTLLLCKVITDRLIYKWHVNINKVCVKVEECDFGTCFHLVKKIEIVEDSEGNRRNGRRSVTVQCNNQQEREEWIKAITREISLLDNITMLLTDPLDKVTVITRL